MGLYEQIRGIAKTKGYSINKLEQELGFARSSIYKFNKNKPGIDKLQQIADLLGVTIDELTGSADTIQKQEQKLNTRDERDIKNDLDSIMKKLTSGEEGPAAYDGEPLDPESAELFRYELEIALRRLKLINKEKYTPKKYKK